MDISAEQIENLFNNRGGSLDLANGDVFTRDDLVQYIDACDIDTDENGTPLDDQWQLLAEVLGAPDPSNMSELTAVTSAAHQLKLAEQKRDEAIRAAINAGHSAINIANCAGLSRARIYQIRDRRR